MERRVAGEVVPSAPKPESEKAPLLKILAAAQPDILGVCEIGPDKDCAELQARLLEAGVDLPHRLVLTGADPERHLGLLSRWPISRDNSLKTLNYQLDGQTFPFQRGILDVSINLSPDYTLRLLGNHLKSRRDVPEADQAVMRRHEALLLRQHIEGILAENSATNLLVYGDFNDTRNEQPIKVIQGAFGTKNYLRDLWLEDSDGYRFTYYWDFADRYDRIDFAFVSSGLWPEIDMRQSYIAKGESWTKASDHRALVLTLKPVERERRR